MKAALTALLLAFSSISSAATFNFNYEATASDTFNFVSGPLGSSMSIGDKVNFTLTTASGYEFNGVNTDSMWAIQGFNEGGTRNADYSFQFFNNGNLVHSSDTFNLNTRSVHMGPSIRLGFSGIFDTFTWSGTLLSSSALFGNTFADISATGPQLQYGYTSADFVKSSELSPVPVPAAAWLFGSALIGFIGFRKSKQTKAA